MSPIFFFLTNATNVDTYTRKQRISLATISDESQMLGPDLEAQFSFEGDTTSIASKLHFWISRRPKAAN